jgi:hypothetical protein
MEGVAESVDRSGLEPVDHTAAARAGSWCRRRTPRRPARRFGRVRGGGDGVRGRHRCGLRASGSTPARSPRPSSAADHQREGTDRPDRDLALGYERQVPALLINPRAYRCPCAVPLARLRNRQQAPTVAPTPQLAITGERSEGDRRFGARAAACWVLPNRLWLSSGCSRTRGLHDHRVGASAAICGR